MNIISWKAGISDPNNQKNLEIIQQWWSGLNNTSVTISLSNALDGANIISQSPETFTIKDPQMRDNKLTWSKPNYGNNWNITAKQLELNKFKTQLTSVSQDKPDCFYSVTV